MKILLRQINFIITELNAKRSSWRRPEYAISWEGVKNIVPEIEAFFSDSRALIYVNLI